MPLLSRIAEYFTRPAWANFFGPGQYTEFVRLLETELTRRGNPGKLDARGGAVVLPPKQTTAGAEPGYWGLTNLAQKCAHHALAEWPEIIADHFDRMERIGDQGSYLESLENNWEEARTLLKVRIYPADLANPGALVAQYPADGLMAALVYDFPESTATVPQDAVDKWKVSDYDLFRIALQNVDAEPEPEVDTFDLPDGEKLHLLQGESFFTASRILSLERYVQQDSPLGALVGVPTRHTLVYYPIRDQNVVKVIQPLLPLLHKLCDDGPGSITDQLYWWRYGHLTHLPSKIEGRQINFSPPESFVEHCLSRLPEADA